MLKASTCPVEHTVTVDTCQWRKGAVSIVYDTFVLPIEVCAVHTAIEVSTMRMYSHMHCR